MSIRAGVVRAITFQQVDAAPHAEAGTQSNNEGLQDFDCRVKKFHGDLLLTIKSLRPRYTPEIVDFDKLPTAAGADLPVYPGPGVNKNGPLWKGQRFKNYTLSASTTSYTSDGLSLSLWSRNFSMSKRFFLS